MSLSKSLISGISVTFAVGISAQSASGTVVGYYGDTNPTYTNSPTNSNFYLQSPGELAFHGVRFGGCSLGSGGGVLSMGTVTRQGVWFGYFPGGVGTAPLNWAMSSNAVGNELTLRAALGSSLSNEFGAYYHDSAFGASIYFTTPSTMNYVVFEAGQAVEATYVFPAGTSALDFHDYRILLKGGLVGYYIDGVPVYEGPAAPSGSGPLMIIGDGSGSSISGNGLWLVDRAVLDLNPTNIVAVPEPTMAVMGLVAAGGLRRGRRSGR